MIGVLSAAILAQAAGKAEKKNLCKRCLAPAEWELPGGGLRLCMNCVRALDDHIFKMIGEAIAMEWAAFDPQI